MTPVPLRPNPPEWPPTDPATVYDYGFYAWPDQQSPRWNPAAYQLFGFLNHRLVMEFTERDFADFREELAKVGFLLVEVERSPHMTPITVL